MIETPAAPTDAIDQDIARLQAELEALRAPVAQIADGRRALEDEHARLTSALQDRRGILVRLETACKAAHAVAAEKQATREEPAAVRAAAEVQARQDALQAALRTKQQEHEAEGEAAYNRLRTEYKRLHAEVETARAALSAAQVSATRCLIEAERELSAWPHLQRKMQALEA